MLGLCEIIDDDGVAVIASEVALRRRYANAAFDYAFPHALLEGMRAAELFAWHTGFEGEHSISVELVTDGAFDDAKTDESTPEHVLFVDVDDALIVFPYSGFTMACDNKGKFDLRKGLATRMEIPASTYRIRVVRVGERDEGASFRVLLCAATEATRTEGFRALPGWP